jgi:hypothetical protein
METSLKLNLNKIHLEFNKINLHFIKLRCILYLVSSTTKKKGVFND